MSRKQNTTNNTKTKKSNDNTLSVEEVYKSMTLHEHILKLPDTYIGGIEEDNVKIWVYDDEKQRMVFKTISYIPGLYKIFDEILINARDHCVRDKTCNKIEVNIIDNQISVKNNGNDGIPIEWHNKEDCYVPEMIFGKILTSGNYEQKGKIVGGKNGVGGKCISHDTLVPLFNGNLKMAKDITLNDKLIGDDGNVRNIKKIITGKGQMYKINQSNGETYKVNDQHILTLHMPDHKVIFWNKFKNGWSVLWWDNNTKTIKSKNIKVADGKKIKCNECGIELSDNLNRHYRRKHKDVKIPVKSRSPPTFAPDNNEVKNAKERMDEFCKTIPDSKVFDISIQDYIKLNNTTKKRLAGIRGECVQWDKKEVLLDPYVLGLWLGDGVYDGYRYVCDGENDSEIINYLQKWCDNNDGNIRETKKKYVYLITSKNNYHKKGYAPLASKLRHYKLIKNKHIPLDYIVNDRDTRLKVLAGLIDTDGTVQRDGTRIIITQGLNHARLVKDIILLTRSLGFYCSLTIKNTSWKHNGILKKGKCFNINISGHIEDIPTILPRKKCAKIKKHSNRTTGHIKVEKIGIDNYVGLEIDSNQRFVINDFTVTHNCANIWSTEFIVEIVDTKRMLKYTQTFSNNMYSKTEPVIEKLKNTKNLKHESYTKITFTPDYTRFGTTNLSNDMYSLFKKRVYDISAVTNVNVYLNDEMIDINDFKDYINLFYEDGEVPSLPVYEVVNDRWKVAVVYDSNSGYRQISFVNGIYTFHGGSHVNHVQEKIISSIYDIIMKKNKNLKVKPVSIRDNLTFFIDAVIEDPSFSSQTKEQLTTKLSNFGSRCEVSDKFIKDLSKTGIVEEVVNYANFKSMDELKRTDGKKVMVLKGMAKLKDAEWAGTKKSHLCKLILTEGDSAKGFAIEGLSVIGHEKYGVFPLRGKLLNVREATAKQLQNNEEIKAIKKIMGFKQNKVYNDVRDLRYGGIIILADQDLDGSHIKGLIMNFIQFFWPSLPINNNFIHIMDTPIVIGYKKTDMKKQNPYPFYTLTAYEDFKTSLGDNIKQWIFKYYKGLGTSDEKEARDAFKDFDKRLKSLIWEDNKITKQNDDNDNEETQEEDEEDDEDEDNKSQTSKKSKDSQEEEDDDTSYKSSESFNAITLAFSKPRAGERKKWLANYDKNNILDTEKTNITYSEFINKELIHFSNYDNIRSIPSVKDGFKPSQRKILYGTCKRKIKDEIKVFQLSGYIADVAHYHHGDASLQGTIVAMAQTFVGSNNINLLQPIGNFGSRLENGKDHASARYISTALNDLTPLIFRMEDECVYNFVNEDGVLAEPEHYSPILPMILIDGTKGIGTGWSTDVSNYNPIDVLNNLRRLINNEEVLEIKPWFRRFKGKVTKTDVNSYTTQGIWEILDETHLKITEIPVGKSISKFKEEIDAMIVDDIKNPKNGQILKSLVDRCGKNSVELILEFMEGELQSLIKQNSLEKTLVLIKKHSTANMHLYDLNDKIKKYNNTTEILQDFYTYRLNMYDKRKKYYSQVLKNQLLLLEWRIKFLDYVISEKITMYQKKKPISKVQIIEQIEKYKFPKLSDNFDDDESEKTYNYITKLGLFDLTQEKRDKLQKQYEVKLEEYNTYINTTIQQIWLNELDEFEKAYDKWLLDMEEKENDNNNDKKKKNTKNTKRTKNIKKNTKK